MEDVLEVYTRPHDPTRPLVCLDETSKQLTRETRAGLPEKPGRAARFDYEYDRNGVASRARRTAVDYTHVLRDLADVHFPKAAKIVLVQDNLNTHRPASLYEAFAPAEARRVAERFEWHYTPKHGSWLNMAECELSVVAQHCLNQRIPEKPALETEADAWGAIEKR